MQTEPPLHQAVIHRNYQAVSLMARDLEHLCRFNALGFSALELAQFLDWRPGIELLGGETKHELNVGTEAPISKNDFDEMFGVRYLPHLKFESYDYLKRTIANCPYLLRWTPLGWGLRRLGRQLRDILRLGRLADVKVKWIDEAMGYGLFARSNFEGGVFIGEYTGRVRPLSREKPDTNAYCFHYPTRYRSRDYTIMDSSQEGNLLRFMNHSDLPTCEPRWALDRGILHLLLFTKKGLAAGEPLTFDYGQDFWQHRQKLPG